MAAQNLPDHASVRQAYDDDMYVDDDSNVDDTRNDGGADGGSSGGTSGTNSSSDEEPDHDVDWSAVGVDYKLVKQALEEFGRRHPRPRTPPVPGRSHGRAPLRPPPARAPFGGDKTFVQWIPYWSDPNWNDTDYTFDDDKGTAEMTNVPALDKQRPALLPKDSLRKPTHYAKRLGIAVHQSDGRSRMSPTTSTTRHAQLSHVQDTFTGRKDYLTVQDAQHFLQGADPYSKPAEILAALLEEDAGNAEHIEAYLRLHEMLEEDEAYQQASFADITTDERVAHDVHSDDPSPVPYSLSGDLHPLVGRHRWLKPDTRGDSEENARLHYNLYGNRGEWCAQNDQVWEILQPVLQFVGRVLSTGHPFVGALLEPRSRRHVDPARLPATNSANTRNWISFTLNYNKTSGFTATGFDPYQVGAEHIAVLDNHGFDLAQVALSFLMERLRLQLFSSNAEWRKGETFAGDHVYWGLTEAYGMEDPEGAGVLVSLGAEMLWPLLVSDFTPKEKASCVMMAASSMLHELGHAFYFAVEVILALSQEDHHGDHSPLHGVADEVILALRALFVLLYGKNECFFEDEHMAEVGFAFENVLFGGTADSGFRGTGLMYNHSIMMPIALQVNPWPWGQGCPHLVDPALLTTPHLPVDAVSAMLPTETYTKYLSQAFWDTQFVKYGFPALKLLPDGGVLAVLDRQYWRQKDIEDVWGSTRGGWLVQALESLRGLGQALLHSYCRELILEKMEPIWVRKRFHYEFKAWPTRTAAFLRFLDKIRDDTEELHLVWQTFNMSQQDKEIRIDWHNRQYHDARLRDPEHIGEVLDWDTYHLRLRQQMSKVFAAMLGGYTDLHHHLLHEIRCVQNLAVDYVQQPPSSRAKLHRHYAGQLYRSIERFLEPAVGDYVANLEQLRSMFERGNALPDDVDDEIRRMRNFLQLDLNHLVKSKFFFSDDNVEVEGLDWRGELETVPRGRAKKKSASMKRMATKELLRAPPAVRQLVDKILGIIDVNKDEARREEEALTRDGIMERMQSDMKVVEPWGRKGDDGKPFWLLPTPASSSSTASASTMKTFVSRPPGATVKPWQAAPPPPAHARGLLFGQPNSLAVSTLPLTPSAGAANFAAKYAGATTAFPKVPEGDSVLRRTTGSPSGAAMDVDVPALELDKGDIGFGTGPEKTGWGPFGTAWCDVRTISEELHQDGVKTPAWGSVFGKPG